MTAQPPDVSARSAPREAKPCGGSRRAPAGGHQPLSISLASARSARVRTRNRWARASLNFATERAKRASPNQPWSRQLSFVRCRHPTALPRPAQLVIHKINLSLFISFCFFFGFFLWGFICEKIPILVARFSTISLRGPASQALRPSAKREL